MKLKLVVAAALLATAGASMAKTQDLGTLTADGASFSNSFLSILPGSFSDTYTFTLAGNGNAYGGVASFGWLGDISLSSISLSGNGLATSLKDTTPGAFSFSNLLAGTYTMVLTGKVWGGATYKGSIESNAVAAPVPEPEAMAMLALGLGFVGFAARRRQKLMK